MVVKMLRVTDWHGAYEKFKKGNKNYGVCGTKGGELKSMQYFEVISFIN